MQCIFNIKNEVLILLKGEMTFLPLSFSYMVSSPLFSLTCQFLISFSYVSQYSSNNCFSMYTSKLWRILSANTILYRIQAHPRKYPYLALNCTFWFQDRILLCLITVLFFQFKIDLIKQLYISNNNMNNIYRLLSM